MGRVKTNDVALAYAVETMLGMAPASGFRELEPNTIGAFGATISTVARTPISRSRQRRKGSITDLDATVEFDADLTLSAFRDFLSGFVFAELVNSDVTDLKVSAVAAANDDYTVDALVAAQADKFEVDTLIWADGFSNADNNGLQVVDTDAMTGHTVISVADGLVDEAGVTDGYISFAGYRTGNATWDYVAASSQATLALAGVGTALTALGLKVGQFVHIGSISEAGGAFQNAFGNGMAVDTIRGYARVRSISADAVIFDKLDAALQDDDNTAKSVDILFGEFARNVDVGGAEYLERHYHFEATYPGLGAGLNAVPAATDTEYEYVEGCYANTLGFNSAAHGQGDDVAGVRGAGLRNRGECESARRCGSHEANPYRGVQYVGRYRADSRTERPCGRYGSFQDAEPEPGEQRER